MYWEDLTGEPLHPCRRVPASEARSRGHNILGVDVEKADGMHRSRLESKDVNTYKAPELIVAIAPVEPSKYILLSRRRARHLRATTR